MSKNSDTSPVTAPVTAMVCDNGGHSSRQTRAVTQAVTAHLHHEAPTNTNGGALDDDRSRCRTAKGNPALDRTWRSARPRSADRHPAAHPVVERSRLGDAGRSR